MHRNEVEERTPAPFFTRAFAFLLDWAIVLLLSIFVSGVLDAGVETRLPVLLVVMSVYHIMFLASAGATPGKMALRMHVADASGARLPPDKAILRYLVFFLSVSVLFIGAIVSVFLLAGDAQRRTLHDRVAGTLVLSGRPSWTERTE